MWIQKAACLFFHRDSELLELHGGDERRPKVLNSALASPRDHVWSLWAKSSPAKRDRLTCHSSEILSGRSWVRSCKTAALASWLPPFCRSQDELLKKQVYTRILEIHPPRGISANVILGKNIRMGLKM